jgi:putative transposase
MPRPKKPQSPFRYFNSSPEVIRLVVMMYVRFPLSLRNVEDLLFERGWVRRRRGGNCRDLELRCCPSGK